MDKTINKIIFTYDPGIGTIRQFKLSTINTWKALVEKLDNMAE